MPQISATIITKNEAANIARAIRSLVCADEVLVVDSESTDSTRDIAAGLGARVVVHPWEGFAAQKAFASREAKHDWILSLDADEELDGRAQEAVKAWQKSEPGAVAYQFARRAQYLGRWILHSGWYPDYKVRLFDRRHACWEGSFVHESVVADGSVATLEGEILHYTCATLDEHRERMEFYTDLAAREMRAQGRSVGLLRQTFGPSWTFFYTYLVRLGVLDGVPGFWLARMAARYTRRKYAKLQALEKGSRAPLSS